MAEGRKQYSRKTPSSKIFISWSGSNSSEFAKALKHCLETDVFPNSDLMCFVSEQDIASGTDWWEKIKKELRTCKLGIICITKENVLAPWIHFETGAMIAKDVPTIPLLINCNSKVLAGTPLNGKQAIDFNDYQKFLKLLFDINKVINTPLSESQIIELGKNAYKRLKDNLEGVFLNLKGLGTFNAKYVYPTDVKIIKRNTVYLSIPMASITADEYPSLREAALKAKKALLDIGFTEVYCPIIDIDSPEHFDGKTKAIKANFPRMKQADSMVIVYPWHKSSSVLVEMGYGLALSKKMVIFHHEDLPFIMAEAGNTIVNIKQFRFTKYEEIENTIRKNEMTMFEGVYDD